MSAVLHVLDHSWPVLSGYSVRSRNLITAQHRLGELIVVLTGPLHQIDEPEAAETTIDGVPHLRTPISGRLTDVALRKRWPLVREYEVIRTLRNRILEVVSKRSICIIYAHSPALCGLAALQAARQRKLPFVYEVRAFWEDAAVDQQRARPTSLRYGLTRRLETYVARQADAVSTIAQNMVQELHSRGIPAEKLFHVPNGVDMDRFSQIERDEELSRKLKLGDNPVFGFFGSLYRYEGVSWMIRAASSLRASGNKFVILIIGRGEDTAAIRDAIRDHNASEYVRHIEAVAHDEISRYYSLVDIVVYPRRSVRLTELVTPLKPLEAMALSKPVLASSVGGIRELVHNEQNGLLFQPDDPLDFCRQAERLLSSAMLRKRLGEGGRAFVARERNWTILARRYREIYDFVLSKRNGAQVSPLAV